MDLVTDILEPLEELEQRLEAFIKGVAQQCGEGISDKLPQASEEHCGPSNTDSFSCLFILPAASVLRHATLARRHFTQEGQDALLEVMGHESFSRLLKRATAKKKINTPSWKRIRKFFDNDQEKARAAFGLLRAIRDLLFFEGIVLPGKE